MKNEETAKRLRLAMGEADISQQDLCEMVGLSKSSISHYINGRYVMGNTTAVKIGKALNVNPMWLMGFDAPKQRKEVSVSFSSDTGNVSELLQYALKLSELNQEDRETILQLIDRMSNKKGF